MCGSIPNPLQLHRGICGVISPWGSDGTPACTWFILVTISLIFTADCWESHHCMLVLSVRTGPRRASRLSGPDSVAVSNRNHLRILGGGGESYRWAYHRHSCRYSSLSGCLSGSGTEGVGMIGMISFGGNSCHSCDNLQFHYRWSSILFLPNPFTAEPFPKYIYIF